MAMSDNTQITPDLRFYQRNAPATLKEVLTLVEGNLISGSDDGVITTIADLSSTDLQGCAVYAASRDHLLRLEGRSFGLCLTKPEFCEGIMLSGGAVVGCISPRLSFAYLARRLISEISPNETAPTSLLDVTVDPTASISQSAKIGTGSVIGPQAVIGPGVEIGPEAHIGAGAVISHTLAGARLRVLPGARIGQAGFGFEPTPQGLEPIPQLGRVRIGDDVDIGANTTIDRGTLDDTIIETGCKIDNLVQIAHNVRLGRFCVIAAQTGISGSCIIEESVFMGGQVGLSDHLTIGRGAKLAAQAGLMRDVPPGEKWGGAPARPVKSWLKEMAVLAKLARKKSDTK